MTYNNYAKILFLGVFTFNFSQDIYPAVDQETIVVDDWQSISEKVRDAVVFVRSYNGDQAEQVHATNRFKTKLASTSDEALTMSLNLWLCFFIGF